MAYLVGERCELLVRVLKHRSARLDRYGYDTRPAHSFIFKDMAPCCHCLIGNYRGSLSCPELTWYTVGVAADPAVGVYPPQVADEMKRFEVRCHALMKVHSQWLTGKGAGQAPANALARFVAVVCDLMEDFLTIHPYANGNGHVARLIVWVLLTRQGYQPAEWPLDGRPQPERPFMEALTAHRASKPGALRAILLKAIIGNPAV